jgi:hypothetical protein
LENGSIDVFCIGRRHTLDQDGCISSDITVSDPYFKSVPTFWVKTSSGILEWRKCGNRVLHGE